MRYPRVNIVVFQLKKKEVMTELFWTILSYNLVIGYIHYKILMKSLEYYFINFEVFKDFMTAFNEKSINV